MLVWGRKRIVFQDKKASFMELKSILETEYPKLKSQDGAFELMRAEGGGYSRPICLVPMPSVRYNIPFLREMVGASTLIYIRPMKSTISMEKAHDTSTSPATECTRCAKKVPISNLRQHNLECKRITIDTGEESLEEEDRLANEVITVVNDGEGP